jgi:hypothetical protein
VYQQRQVNKALKKLDQILPSNRVPISAILETLNKAFKRKAIVFTHKTDSKIRKDGFTVEGTLYENDERSYIEISILTGSQLTIDFDRAGYIELFFKLSQTIQHELIHKLQLQMRGEEIHTLYSVKTIQNRDTGTDDIAYYSLPTEIEAHAHDIVLELTRNLGPNIEKWKNKTDSITFLQKNSETYLSYARTFKSWKTHKINIKLMKHVMRFLNHGVCWKA